MAFPDYGPLIEISQFTQDGLAQGAFLFELFAGERGSMALHYVGLMFAMIGSIAIVFIKQFHNIKTIFAWTFLILVLLIGPRNNNIFFIEIPVNNVEHGMSSVKAFTPQAMLIDGMSKIHKAIFTGFFDVSDPSEPRMRNAIEDAMQQVDGSGSRDLTLNERPDIRQEIFAYKAMGCGDPIDLATPLYNPSWQKEFEDQIATPHPQLNIKPAHLSVEETYNLQKKLFKARDIKTLLLNYDKLYKNDTARVYPPFGVLYEDPTTLQTSLEKSGVPSEQIDKVIDHFNFVDGGQLLKRIVSDPLPYAFTSKKRLTDEISGNITGVFPSNTPAGTYQSPIISGFITATQGLDDWSGKEDAIEARLQHKDYNFLTDKSDREAWLHFVENTGPKKQRADVPMMLAFITAPPAEIYSSRKDQSVGDDTDKRDVSGLSEYYHLNVVTTCAQLHHMTHTHILDAVAFQNIWPGHGDTTNSEGDRVYLTRRDGFEDLSDSGDGEYNYFPYDTQRVDDTSPQMRSFESRIQVIANALRYEDQSGATPLDKNLMLDTNVDTRKAAAELVRKAFVNDILTTTLRATFIPTPSKYTIDNLAEIQDEITNQTQDPISQGINIRVTEGPQENIESIASWLHKPVQWGANIAAVIGSEFAGANALAFIKFLQLFIGIAIFFVAMCTPILFMMGVLLPKQAPGVIATCLITIVALKAIPIGFTLVDAMMSIVMKSMEHNMVERSLMIYVTATAYTSVTMITFFLLFKAGDTEAVMGQMSQLDQKANEAAEAGVKAVKIAAAAIAAPVAAGAMGAVGAGIAAKAKGLTGTALSQATKDGAITQGKEVFSDGLTRLPGVGGFASETLTAYREGSAQGRVMADVHGENQSIDNKLENLDANLSKTKFALENNMDIDDKTGNLVTDGTPLSAERRTELETRRDSLEDSKSDLKHSKRSWREHEMGYRDAQAEGKYRSIHEGSQRYFASQRADKQFTRDAKAAGFEDTFEAKRNALDAQAQSANNSVLQSATQQKNVEFAGDVTMNGVEMSRGAAQAMASGIGSAIGTNMASDPDRIVNMQKNALNSEVAKEMDDLLANTIDGPGRKPIFAAFQRAKLDENGEVMIDASGEPIMDTVKQETMFEQAGGILKGSINDSDDPALKNMDAATKTKITEYVAAQIQAEHMRGELNWELGEHKDAIANALGGEEVLNKKLTSGKTASLWIKPSDKGYEKIRQLTGTGQGEGISLLNLHAKNSISAQQRAMDAAIEHQQKLDRIDATIGGDKKGSRYS